MSLIFITLKGKDLNVLQQFQQGTNQSTQQFIHNTLNTFFIIYCFHYSLIIFLPHDLCISSLVPSLVVLEVTVRPLRDEPSAKPLIIDDISLKIKGSSHKEGAMKGPNMALSSSRTSCSEMRFSALCHLLWSPSRACAMLLGPSASKTITLLNLCFYKANLLQVY